MVRHFWERNDVKGAINAVQKLPDHSVSSCCKIHLLLYTQFLNIIWSLQVQADVVSALVDRMDVITLDLFSCLLPVLLGLLESRIER